LQKISLTHFHLTVLSTTVIHKKLISDFPRANNTRLFILAILITNMKCFSDMIIEINQHPQIKIYDDLSR